MTRNTLILLAMAGSAALLLGALAFQYVGGLVPCVLCIYQRWPHVVALVFGVLALWRRKAIWPILAGLAAATSSAIGVFHVGVEQKWWEGLQTCTVDTLKGVKAADLLNIATSVGAPVRCDAIAWQMFGVSMAGWNVLISAAIALIWWAAARRQA